MTPAGTPDPAPSPASPPPFGAALRTFTRIGLLSFGGPAGQIAVMHRILVEEARWISDATFLHALKFCNLLPGPEAQQLATYLGWRLHGWRGGVAAGLLFILPGAAAMLLLCLLYVGGGEAPVVAGIFAGLKPAILAVVASAMIRIGRRALTTPVLWALSAGAFVALFAFAVPFPAVVALAALAGLALARRLPAPAVDGGPAASPDRPGRPAVIVTVGLVLWGLPVAALMLAAGPGSVLAQQGWFFSKAAVVTFGGAYAVLAYVAQRAVVDLGWLAPGQMVDGLALAETTPGPLILVLQFVGFVAAFQAGQGPSPLLAGLAGTAITLWVTFVPSFLFVLAGAPYVERLRRSRALGAALTAVTAAVVGVIANLTVWFSMRVLFAARTPVTWGPVRLDLPVAESLSPGALLLAAGAAVALFGLRLGMGRTLLLAALGGVLLQTLGVR
jgi:chromate transporter